MLLFMNRSASTSAQATEPTYELHSLGWKAFQQLCVSVASEIWGQVVQGFFDSNDGGRDGAFHGTWTSRRGESFQGNFTAQCKFFASQNKVLRPSDLKDEQGKAARLAERGLAENYILFTNARLTGTAEDNIRATFESIPGITRFAAYGSERISQFIRESPRLRSLIPRVYGLGDLSQIMDERAYDQAREILSSLGDDLAKFVITNAYRNSTQALIEHGFVILLGEPACGKSAIAAGLALGALDEWGCSTLKIRDADDFVTHSNPHEAKQFFWIDDAFGGTQLDWEGTIRWNGAFPHVRAAIRRGAKFVFTSRDYIYRNARNFLKESALPVLNEAQVVIRVEQLTKDEREQILYNHVRLGSQPATFKRQIKSLLPAVAAHRRFSPEIARRLGNPAFTKTLHLSAYSLDDFVENNTELLQEVIRTLDAGSRSAIALVFMRDGLLQSPITLTPEEEHAIELLGASPGELRTAIVALDGGLLIQVQQRGSVWWRFKHPTIRDAFAALVAENRELMDIYLLGTPIERLFTEISCGNAKMRGIKVVVPADRYEALMPRIENFLRDRRENQDAVNRFLASRCGRVFLARFIERNPNFLASLDLMSYFYAVSDVSAVNRLQELELLPEHERLRHVARVRELAVRTPDAGFLDKDIISFLTEDEVKEILEHVRSTFLPNLDGCIESWRDAHDSSEDPEEGFRHLKTALKEYEAALSEDTFSTLLIDSAMTRIDEVVQELQAAVPETPDWGDFHPRQGQSEDSAGSRSIFDDVDE
jgi:hypothetical protein